MTPMEMSIEAKMTLCFWQRFFGDSTALAALRTPPPSNRRYGYAFQSGHVLRTTTTALSSGGPMSDAG